MALICRILSNIAPDCTSWLNKACFSYVHQISTSGYGFDGLFLTASQNKGEALYYLVK